MQCLFDCVGLGSVSNFDELGLLELVSSLCAIAASGYLLEVVTELTGCDDVAVCILNGECQTLEIFIGYITGDRLGERDVALGRLFLIGISNRYCLIVSCRINSYGSVVIAVAYA